jgi:hypothetical protein
MYICLHQIGFIESCTDTKPPRVLNGLSRGMDAEGTPLYRFNKRMLGRSAAYVSLSLSTQATIMAMQGVMMATFMSCHGLEAQE